jgi:hypothetical protein
MLLPWPLDPAALRLCVSAALPSRQRVFGFFRDLGQQYDMVSRVAVNFSYLRVSTQTFFGVSHSAWYALSLPKSVYPGYSTRGILLVCGPAPQVYFWFFVTQGYYPRCIVV